MSPHASRTGSMGFEDRDGNSCSILFMALPEGGVLEGGRKPESDARLEHYVVDK